MNEEKRVWIYCRVLDSQAEELLEYQEKLLTDYAWNHQLVYIGLSKDIGHGDTFAANGIQRMIFAITNDLVDVILAYSKTRIIEPINLYEEFELLCSMHHVEIITLKK